MHRPHQSSGNIQRCQQGLPQIKGGWRIPPVISPFGMDPARQVPLHELCDLEEVWRRETTAEDPHDIWMEQPGHDLELELLTTEV